MAGIRFEKLLLCVSIGAALAAQAQAQSSVPGVNDAMARLSMATGSQTDVAMHPATGSARFVRARAGATLRTATAMRAMSDAALQASAAQFLGAHGALFGVTDPSRELVAVRSFRERAGAAHLTHQQVYNGVPVFGAELKSHFDAAGNLTVVNGTFVPAISLSTTPALSADAAAERAVASVRSDLRRAVSQAPAALTPTLVIYREGLAQGVPGANRLAWKIEVTNRRDVREFIFVDAMTGKVIDRINGIHDAKNRRAFDAAGSSPPYPNYPNNPFWVEGQGFPTGTNEADNMIQSSSEIYDLFKTAFGRDSFDGNGARMDSIFNRGDGCPNASWNGTYISFCPGTTTDDVTAHEWAHAYTEYTHNLIYAWQPGALNEAYSDIWGETVDRLNGRGTDTPDGARAVGVCAVNTTPPSVIVTAPASIAGTRGAGTAGFGPSSFNVSSNVVGVDIGSTSAACAALPAGSLTGAIAFIDRGTCGFTIKVKNAQNAGAVGVVIGNNAGGTSVIGMAGADPTITIPSLMVTQNDGTAIKAQLANGVTATLARTLMPTYDKLRWLMGEDSTAFGGAIRDMYNPTCFGHPGKVSDTQYVCSTSDNGGVHTNSGVANHGYALLVDGGTYNGQTVNGIGLTKAAHIYFRAQSVYQGPASGFADHADALAQSCTDLSGQNLADLRTGLPSGEVINASDCGEVAKMALAVELRSPPAQCNFRPVLAKSPPPLCASGAVEVIAADNFEGGKRNSLRWTLSNSQTTGDFSPSNWGVVSNVPAGGTGYAMYIGDPDIGACSTGSDASSTHRLDSPEIVVPAGTTQPRMAFDHWIATEAGYDGGNVKISVNGGAWQLVSAANFVYNAYNTTLVGSNNTNPMAGQAAFSGTDAGSVSGSWGQSIVNLAPYAVAGDRVKLRFEFGKDCASGRFGWYVDNVKLYRCTP